MEKQIQLSENYTKEYERRSHRVGISMWRFEWCTKYRYGMFGKDEYKNLIIACIRRAASMHKIKIIELNVQPEHVHCVVGISLSMAPIYALQILKGVSSGLFFQFRERARLRYPRGHLWSPGKFAASLGFIQLDVAKNYVRNRDEHHRQKPWALAQGGYHFNMINHIK
jgi:putative transposase